MADIALITIAALILVRAPTAKRLQLSMLTVGLVFIAVSDTAFVYLAAVGGFHQQQVITIGWVWGFPAIGLAAVVVHAPSRGQPHPVAQVPSQTAVWLPYVSVLVSTAICTPMLIAGLGPVVVAATVTVFAVMIRQFLVIGENRRLRIEVADQALRDPLTGLANRTLFRDRLAHAMQLHQHHSLAVSVLLLISTTSSSSTTASVTRQGMPCWSRYRSGWSELQAAATRSPGWVATSSRC